MFPVASYLEEYMVLRYLELSGVVKGSQEAWRSPGLGSVRVLRGFGAQRGNLRIWVQGRSG